MANVGEMSYDEVLTRMWDDIPKPQFLPDGSWRFRCISAKAIAPKTSDQSTRVNFAMVPEEAMDDVDTHALQAMGENYDLEDNVIFVSVWLSRNGDYAKVRNILEKMGVNCEGRSLADSLKDAKNREFIGHVGMGSYTNKATGEIRQENVITTFSELN